MHAGDYMLAMNILLSGNNFRKVDLLFRFMNIGSISHNLFDQVQLQYCVPVIKSVFNTTITSVRQSLQDKSLILAGMFPFLFLVFFGFPV